ncbi:helix-turn-helix transcriptional regulator [Polynucleobacter nymphae]|uniref:helix-turn-helix transcriptional regulator n=1 Tax=Polynucleobacter nymphae TaxID=2081043 RepID=UPI001C0D1883|nr:AlpA family phage regulatory protein [Polynucleobacter nymphae]MBU3606875.1 AlpA family phage regulatory protein [Polynucleobacter nymphae]
MDAISTNISDTKELLNSFKHDLVQRCQLIRIEEVSAITTLAKSSINLWVAQGKFVAPISLSPTVKVWKLQDVVNWIEAKLENNGAQQ